MIFPEKPRDRIACRLHALAALDALVAVWATATLVRTAEVSGRATAAAATLGFLRAATRIAALGRLSGTAAPAPAAHVAVLAASGLIRTAIPVGFAAARATALSGAPAAGAGVAAVGACRDTVRAANLRFF